MKKEFKFQKKQLTKEQAANFVKTSSKFQAEIFLYHNNKKVNAKSLMGVLAVSLSLCKEDEIMLTAVGTDAEKAIKELELFFI